MHVCISACPLEPCEDVLPNCEEYGEQSCVLESYRIWATLNCRKHCGLCVGQYTTVPRRLVQNRYFTAANVFLTASFIRHFRIIPFGELSLTKVSG